MHRSPCELYAAGHSYHDNGLDAGAYLAAVRAEKFPSEYYSDDRIVRHGYGVGIGQWYFFDDFEPAFVFGRAARMSFDCSGWGVYRAAHVTQHCLRHGDERVLLVAESVQDRREEADVLKRFAQGLHPESAYWHEHRAEPGCVNTTRADS